MTWHYIPWSLTKVYSLKACEWDVYGKPKESPLTCSWTLYPQHLYKLIVWPRKKAVFVYKYNLSFKAITAWLKAEEVSWAQGWGKQKDEGKTATASYVARGPDLNIKPLTRNRLLFLNVGFEKTLIEISIIEV